MIQVQKIDSIRNPKLKRVKSLEAMVRIDNQIIQLAVYTGSPVSFLNWATAKEIMDKSNKVRFIPSGKLNLHTKFVDYNKQPICVLGALKTNFRSAGWDVKGATFLVTERSTRFIMGLDLQGQMGIVTTQKPAPKEFTRFDVLMCEQSEGSKEKNFSINSEIYLRNKKFQKTRLYVRNLSTPYVQFKKRGEKLQFISRIKSRKKSKNC